MGDGVAKMETPAFMPGRTSIKKRQSNPGRLIMSRGRQLVSIYRLRHAPWLCWALWLLIAATATAVSAQGLPSGAISGRLVVPPDIALEVEPNDDIPQAQVMTETPSILGESSQDDPGMILPIPDNSVKLEDLYRIQTTGQTQIVLTIATNDLFSNDLDLILLDLNGNLLDASEGFVATEVLGIPAGDFILAIRTFQGASAYLLVAQSANLSPLPPTFSMTSTAPFRPGEVVVKLKLSKLGSSQNAQSFAKTYGFHQTVAAPDGVTLLKHVEVPAAGMANAQGNTKLGLAASPEQRLKTVTLDTIRRLQLDPGVVYAEPNYIHQVSRVPNDEFYGSQWHYELINLPEAWDL